MSQYLPEDQDLLRDIEDVGETSIGSKWNKQQHRLNEIQIKATLRSRKTMEDFNQSTERYSYVLVFFAVVQAVVGICQLIFSFVTSNFKYVALNVGMFTILAIGLVIYYFFKQKR
jgi:hypothetical protein